MLRPLCAPGKLTYADGVVFEGMWRADRRNGVGTLHSTNGDVFVGSWMQDQRQGLGTTYMPSRGELDCRKAQSLHVTHADVLTPIRQAARSALTADGVCPAGKKHVAEYLNDMPTCGSFFELTDDDVEAPPNQQLRNTIISHALQAAVAGKQSPGLPVLQLMQPSKV